MTSPAATRAFLATKGRCFLAARDIAAGEVVLVARPYALVPDADNCAAVCSRCVQPLAHNNSLSVSVSAGTVSRSSCPAEQQDCCTNNYNTCSSNTSSADGSGRIRDSYHPSAAPRPALSISCPGGCEFVRYCSLDCQRLDWLAYHSMECSSHKRLSRDIAWHGMTGLLSEASFHYFSFSFKPTVKIT
jgi:hypothetical protein